MKFSVFIEIRALGNGVHMCRVESGLIFFNFYLFIYLVALVIYFSCVSRPCCFMNGNATYIENLKICLEFEISG